MRPVIRHAPRIEDSIPDGFPSLFVRCHAFTFDFTAYGDRAVMTMLEYTASEDDPMLIMECREISKFKLPCRIYFEGNSKPDDNFMHDVSLKYSFRIFDSCYDQHDDFSRLIQKDDIVSADFKLKLIHGPIENESHFGYLQIHTTPRCEIKMSLLCCGPKGMMSVDYPESSVPIEKRIPVDKLPLI